MASDIGKYTNVGSIPDGSQGSDTNPGSPLILSGPYEGESFWYNTIHAPLAESSTDDGALDSTNR